MPMPKRSSVDDFFVQLNDVQRPHLERAEGAEPRCRPGGAGGAEGTCWCTSAARRRTCGCFRTSRTTAAAVPATVFATEKAAVEAAGDQAGEGFIKLPYDRELPTELLKALMQARGRGGTKRPAPAGTILLPSPALRVEAIGLRSGLADPARQLGLGACRRPRLTRSLVHNSGRPLPRASTCCCRLLRSIASDTLIRDRIHAAVQRGQLCRREQGHKTAIPPS